MKLRYKIIIVFGAIVVGVLIGFGFFKIFNHEQETNVNEKTQLSKYFLEYFNDTLEEELSVEALIENGYISNTNENKCNIYVINDNNISKEETNCEKAKEIAKRPIIELVTSNNFKLNEWNKNGGSIEVKLKNGGNSYYKESDIKSIEWFSIDGSINSVDKVLEINENVNKTLNLLVNFDDVSYVKETKVMIDNEAPVFKGSDLTNRVKVSYEDNYFLNKIYYYFSTDSKTPNKEDFSDGIEDVLCDNTYNVWSYATDRAGNESDIQYLGTYIRCKTINSGTFSGD